MDEVEWLLFFQQQVDGIQKEAMGQFARVLKAPRDEPGVAEARARLLAMRTRLLVIRERIDSIDSTLQRYLDDGRTGGSPRD